MPYRVYVPKTWDGKASLPIILMLHGAGANEGTYQLDQADGLLMKLASSTATSSSRRWGSRPLAPTAIRFGFRRSSENRSGGHTKRRRDSGASAQLNLSELEVMTVLEMVTEGYGADRARTYLAGH